MECPGAVRSKSIKIKGKQKALKRGESGGRKGSKIGRINWPSCIIILRQLVARLIGNKSVIKIVVSIVGGGKKLKDLKHIYIHTYIFPFC